MKKSRSINDNAILAVVMITLGLYVFKRPTAFTSPILDENGLIATDATVTLLQPAIKCVLWFLIAGSMVALFHRICLSGRLQIHEQFFLMSILLGVAYLFSLTPFFGLDAANHFVRAYGITKGAFLIPEGGQIAVPNNLFPYPDYVHTPYIVSQMISLKLDASDTVLHDATNMALYSPVSYVLQAIGIGIANLFTDRTVILAYSASLVNLIGNTFLLTQAIRYIPYGKRTLTILSLCPMAIQLRCGLSVDAVTYSSVVAMLSFCMYHRQTQMGMSKRTIALMYILAVLIASCKIVYFPAAFLVWMIPQTCFGEREKAFFHKVACSAVTLAFSFGWLAIASGYLSSTRGGGTAAEKVMFILTNPIRYGYILNKTFWEDGWLYVKEMLGYKLGITNVVISPVLVVLLLLILCYVFLKERSGMGGVEPDIAACGDFACQRAAGCNKSLYTVDNVGCAHL